MESNKLAANSSVFKTPRYFILDLLIGFSFSNNFTKEEELFTPIMRHSKSKVVSCSNKNIVFNIKSSPLYIVSDIVEVIINFFLLGILYVPAFHKNKNA